jgi:hypothetical protein
MCCEFGDGRSESVEKKTCNQVDFVRQSADGRSIRRIPTVVRTGRPPYSRRRACFTGQIWYPSLLDLDSNIDLTPLLLETNQSSHGSDWSVSTVCFDDKGTSNLQNARKDPDKVVSGVNWSPHGVSVWSESYLRCFSSQSQWLFVISMVRFQRQVCWFAEKPGPRKERVVVWFNGKATHSTIRSLRSTIQYNTNLC